ncbi:proline-rich acidic protein 1 [Cynocephalus volans]|uniref:proline-rich acidic protein 1 n=1 Tax=Cynocephalus volans TaxID=110931 RepID=UPI002FCB79D7
MQSQKVFFKIKGEHGTPEQDTEKASGIRLVEPPEKDDQLVGLLPASKEKPRGQGAKAWVETEDILGRVWSPQRGPEPDLDGLYHPPPEEAQGEEGPSLQVTPSLQVLQGPEEDRDHIYHPVEGSEGP